MVTRFLFERMIFIVYCMTGNNFKTRQSKPKTN